jgi:hypothetical protein
MRRIQELKSVDWDRFLSDSRQSTLVNKFLQPDVPWRKFTKEDVIALVELYQELGINCRGDALKLARTLKVSLDAALLAENLFFFCLQDFEDGFEIMLQE